ncbi:MAG: hypothetical protein GPOALKHO_001820 [Sodalis sp.]|nr:MAG: hypothetical protein GPOALKHO_001820 [Sodalis sp.]
MPSRVLHPVVFFLLGTANFTGDEETPGGERGGGDWPGDTKGVMFLSKTNQCDMN